MIETSPTPGLLVAMPSLIDPYFQKTLILLCEFTKESAFGVIINRPSGVFARDVFVLSTPLPSIEEHMLLIGGPVQPDFLWAIHTTDFKGHSTIPINAAIAMSSLREIAQAIANQQGPREFQLGCGYSGWGEGQLDRELTEGTWWLAPLNATHIVETPYESRWEAVLNDLGMDPNTTSFITPGQA